MADTEKLKGLYAAYREGNVEGRYRGRYRKTGKKFDAQFCHVWTMRGEVLTRFQQYTDTAQWQAAMGVG